MDLNQVTLVCVDYDASVEFYMKLGLIQIVDSPPRYARFETPSGSTLSIHSGERDDIASGTVVYFEVDDVDGTVEALRANGIEFLSMPTDQRWLWREAYTNDPAGNRICIYHAGENRRYPPWRVKQ
ncbi:MAG: VOC family protein [Chromatiales bacterium]|nr:MAG: VOC family protein [Chromatiales bacterium]